MAILIVVVGLLNFLLGYGLALVLADSPLLGLSFRADLRGVWQAAKARFVPAKSLPLAAEENAEPEPPSFPLQEAATTPVTLAMDVELPDSWQQTLGDHGLRLNTLAVGVAHFVRLEAAVYGEHLLTTEARARQAWKDQDPLVMEHFAADLRFINGDWVSKLRQAAELVEEQTGRHGPLEKVAAELARFVRDQAGQISDIDREIHDLNFRAEEAAACRRLISDLQQLLSLAHEQRDETLRLLAALLRGEGRLKQLDEKLQRDPGTGLLCGLGLEVLFAQEFPAGTRPTSAMLISLDRLGKVNQRLGSRGGDQVLKCVAQLIAELAPANSGSRLVSRHRGDQFLVWTQQPSVAEMISTGEYFRQSLEGANFHCEGIDLSLTATVSVATVSGEDELPEILDRLAKVHAAAKRSGQNRCGYWENGVATLALPPAIPISARHILVETTAA